MNRLLCLILSTFMCCLLAQAQHKGYVFIDKNTNGILDNGEKPLSNVVLSDGVNFTRTDRNGEFVLSGHAKERFVFITTPSGYKNTTTHYRRAHADSIYAFGLVPYESSLRKDGSHTFLHISDTEIRSPKGHADWVEMLRETATNERASFIVHTGDICYEGGLRSHIQLMNGENMGIPVFYTIGNHDLIKGEYGGEHLYEKLYGSVFYSFDVGNTHYVVVPMLYGDYRPSYTKEDVYTWLKGDLAMMRDGQSLVIFAHDLQSADKSYIYELTPEERIDLKEHNLKAWMYGHLHNTVMMKKNGVYDICTSTPVGGGIDHSPASFRMLNVDASGNIESDLRYSYVDKSLEIASVRVVGGDDNLLVSVNAYNTTSPVEKLLCYYTFGQERKRYKAILRQNTVWNWEVLLSTKGVKEGTEVYMEIVSLYENGEQKTVKERVEYVKRVVDKVNPSTDWENFLGNSQHDGVTSASISPKLSLAWCVNLGGLIYSSSPLVSGGIVYVGTSDDNLQGATGIHALCARTGKKLWYYPTRNSIKNSMTIDGDFIIGQDIEGYLYALDKHTGALQWEYKLKAAYHPQITEGVVSNDGVVYAGTRTGLCALDIATGKELWSGGTWANGGEGSLCTISYNKDVIITGSQWRGLYANCARTGQLLWHKPKGDIRNSSSSASMHGNLLYITAKNSLYIIETLTGEVILCKEFPFSVDVSSTPLVSVDYIVFGSADSGMVAIDKETHETKWVFDVENTSVQTVPYLRNAKPTVESSPILCGKTLYFGSSAGIFYGVDLESGKEVWKHRTSAPIFGSMAASGNVLYGVDMSGNVYCFTDKYSILR